MALWKDIIDLYDDAPTHRDFLPSICKIFETASDSAARSLRANTYLSDNNICYVAHRYSHEDAALDPTMRLYLVSRLRPKEGSKFPIQHGNGEGQHGTKPICYFDRAKCGSELLTSCIFLKGTYNGKIDLEERYNVSTWILKQTDRLAQSQGLASLLVPAKRILRARVRATVEPALTACHVHPFPSIETLRSHFPSALALPMPIDPVANTTKAVQSDVSSCISSVAAADDVVRTPANTVTRSLQPTRSLLNKQKSPVAVVKAEIDETATRSTIASAVINFDPESPATTELDRDSLSPLLLPVSKKRKAPTPPARLKSARAGRPPLPSMATSVFRRRPAIHPPIYEPPYFGIHNREMRSSQEHYQVNQPLRSNIEHNTKHETDQCLLFAAPGPSAKGALHARAKAKTLAQAKADYNALFPNIAAAKVALSTMSDTGKLLVLEDDCAWRTFVKVNAVVWHHEAEIPQDSYSYQPWNSYQRWPKREWKRY